jgi:hypothetical protein
MQQEVQYCNEGTPYAGMMCIGLEKKSTGPEVRKFQSDES